MGNAHSNEELESVVNDVAQEFLLAIIEEADELLEELNGSEEEGEEEDEEEEDEAPENVRAAFLAIHKQLVQVKKQARRFDVIGDGHTLEPWAVEALCTVVQASECVGQLSLRNCGIGNVEPLAEMITENESVRMLDLSENKFGSDGALQLLEALKENSTVQTLRLALVGCTSEAFVAAAEVMGESSSLARLDMRGNSASEESLQAIFEVVERERRYHEVEVGPWDAGTSSGASDGDAVGELAARISARAICNLQVQYAVDSIINRAFVDYQIAKRVEETTSLQGIPGIADVKGDGRGDTRRKRGGTIDVSVMRAKLEASRSKQFPITKSTRFLFGSHETVGRRNEMQDTMLMRGTFCDCATADMFAVFDGHGSKKSSEFVGEHYPGVLQRLLEDEVERRDAKSILQLSGDQVRAAMRQSFLDINAQMKDHIHHGTTAVVALLLGRVLYVANAGDSRAVLVHDSGATRLTVDHKADVPEEKQRVKDAGGFVALGRVQGVLQVSRALGDGAVQPYVSADPYMSTTELTAEDQQLVLACDGVFDVFSDDVTAQIARANPNPEVAAQKIVVQAYESGSTDNISCIVIRLRPSSPAPSPPHHNAAPSRSAFSTSTSDDPPKAMPAPTSNTDPVSRRRSRGVATTPPPRSRGSGATPPPRPSTSPPPLPEDVSPSRARSGAASQAPAGRERAPAAESSPSLQRGRSRGAAPAPPAHLRRPVISASCPQASSGINVKEHIDVPDM